MIVGRRAQLHVPHDVHDVIQQSSREEKVEHGPERNEMPDALLPVKFYNSLLQYRISLTRQLDSISRQPTQFDRCIVKQLQLDHNVMKTNYSFMNIEQNPIEINLTRQFESN